MPLPVAIILGILSAIAATVLSYIFLVPEKKRAKLSGFFGFLADLFNFKYLVLEKVLKALYIFGTTLCVFGGFFLLIGGQYVPSWMGGTTFISTWYVGLILMIVGPVALRLTYEMFMMFILLVNNTIQINRKLGAPSEPDEPAPVAPVVEPRVDPVPAAEPAPAPAPQPEPDYRFCAHCGTRYDANQGGCPNGCGK